MIEKRIYLDSNATTSLDPRVLKAMLKDLYDLPGNPSSTHYFGQRARQLLIGARKDVAAFLGVRSQEIVFTSGGTEALNMIIGGIADKHTGGHIITSSAEHSAVINPLQHLVKQGWKSTFLNPGPWGALKPEDVKDAIRPDTCLIVLMAVNNETGVKTDIEGVASVALEAGIPFVVDSVALLGKDPVSIPDGVSSMCFSGHKFHGPKGIGVAWVSRSVKFSPLIFGGWQEHGVRGGTENLAGVLGMAEAMNIIDDGVYDTIRLLRDHFEKSVMGLIRDVNVNGEGPRVSNTSNIAFQGIDCEALLIHLDIAGVAASHGSACSAGALQPSHVLESMGLPTEIINSSVRFSFSRMNTVSEIDKAVEIIARIVTKIRNV